VVKLLTLNKLNKNTTGWSKTKRILLMKKAPLYLSKSFHIFTIYRDLPLANYSLGAATKALTASPVV
jgi:hypothetical protein